LSVFEYAGLPLVAPMTWPSRTDDETLQLVVLSALEKDLGRVRNRRSVFEKSEDIEKATSLLLQEQQLERHIEAIRRLPIIARFRPEEVAAAAVMSGLPASFEQVIRPARDIAAHFAQRAASTAGA